MRKSNLIGINIYLVNSGDDIFIKHNNKLTRGIITLGIGMEAGYTFNGYDGTHIEFTLANIQLKQIKLYKLKGK